MVRLENLYQPKNYSMLGRNRDITMVSVAEKSQIDLCGLEMMQLKKQVELFQIGIISVKLTHQGHPLLLLRYVYCTVHYFFFIFTPSDRVALIYKLQLTKLIFISLILFLPHDCLCNKTTIHKANLLFARFVRLISNEKYVQLLNSGSNHS